MVIPAQVTSAPVGAIPRNRPRCVPRAVQRTTTVSRSAASTSSRAYRRSGKAARAPAMSCRSPAGPPGL
jgi:hypothetical protein